MAFSHTLSSLFDSKLRHARRTAKQHLASAGQLIAGNALAEEGKKDLQEARQAVEESLQTRDAAAIQKATDKLGQRLKKHGGDKLKKAKRGDSWSSIAIAVLCALTLRGFVFEAFKIPSGSMIPTLAIGDQIFVNKYIYGIRIPFTTYRIVDFSMPERGDVVVFIYPGDSGEDYIKRVIGLPGDEVEVRKGRVYLNGQPVPQEQVATQQYWDRDRSGRWQPFEAHTYMEQLGDHTYEVLKDSNTLNGMSDYGPRVVPEGKLFMLGDNRDNSHDSRSWGFVPVSHVVGRATFVWWSWGKDGLDKGRIGTWINQ